MRGLTRPLVTLIATAALASGAVTATAPAAFAGPAAGGPYPPPDSKACKQALESLRSSLPELTGAVDQALVGTVRQDLDESIEGLASNKIPNSQKLVEDLTEVLEQLPRNHHPRLFEAVSPAVQRCLPGTAVVG